jgi:hypothetical protein
MDMKYVLKKLAKVVVYIKEEHLYFTLPEIV